MTYKSVKLPGQPLIDYVASRGGVLNLPGTSGFSDPAGRGQMEKGETVHVASPEEWATRRRVERALERAGREGAITLRQADRICCEVLHRHPMEIWSADDYFAGLDANDYEMEAAA